MNDQLWTKFESSLHNQGLTKKRIHKLKTMYKVLQRGLKKSLENVTREDIENWIDDLHRNKFCREDGQPYKGSVKSDIKKFIKQFFKWYKGDGVFFPKEVSWIRTRISKDEQPEEKPVLTKTEVIRLANSFQKIEYRILTLLLFDSGFRIQEMLSTKRANFVWEEYDLGEKCFWISCNESKTQKRKIPVPLFTEDLQTFFNSTYYQNLNADDNLFTIRYDNYLKALKEKSLKLFNQKIGPHSLRHSSATHYSREFDGNMNFIADRYGWAYGSKQLQHYIRRSGAYQKTGAKKVFGNEVSKLREECLQLKGELDKIKNHLAERRKYDHVLEKLLQNEQVKTIICSEDFTVSV